MRYLVFAVGHTNDSLEPIILRFLEICAWYHAIFSWFRRRQLWKNWATEECLPQALLLFWWHTPIFFEHDRYEWHLDLNGDSLDNHNKRFAGTPFNISRLDLTPELHFTIHISYTGRVIEKLTNSVCHAHKAKDALNVPSHCKNLERPHMDLFLFNNARNHFEGWCCGKEGRKLCETLIRKHYEDVGRVLRSNNRLFNTSHVRVIENIASEHFQTQCSPFMYWGNDINLQ